MKKLTNILTFTLISLVLASCSNKGLKVVTQESAQDEVENYDTYAWVDDIENIPNGYAIFGPQGTLIFNNESSSKMIKEAIELQMEARGFSHDHRNPEMLVNFNVLEEDTELREYILNNGQDYLGFGPRSEEVKMVPVDAGTVLINFLDAKTGSQIWQGFASGALMPEDTKNMSILRTKVAAIFENFDFNQFNSED